MKYYVTMIVVIILIIIIVIINIMTLLLNSFCLFREKINKKHLNKEKRFNKKNTKKGPTNAMKK